MILRGYRIKKIEGAWHTDNNAELLYPSLQPAALRLYGEGGSDLLMPLIPTRLLFSTKTKALLWSDHNIKVSDSRRKEYIN